MMHYDIVVIGGGIAGYTAAIRSLQAGKKTLLINQGQSALHFSSGSIDVLAKLPDGSPVTHPFEALNQLKQQNDQHPYHLVGQPLLMEGLDWFKRTITDAGLPMLHHPQGANHQRITPLGTLKATWLSQPFVYQHHDALPFKRIVVIAIDGYRDFHPQMLQDNLRQHVDFANTHIEHKTITLPGFDAYRRNPNELRSIDIARFLKQQSAWDHLCHALTALATPDDLVILPAIMGNGDGLILMNKLREATQLHFHEVPTMPPSLLGIRIEETLNRIFIQLGGTQLKGDKVVRGTFTNGQLNEIYTQNLRDIPVQAPYFIMATGSYFSQGLAATQDQISEPIFGLKVSYPQQRTLWRNRNFFAPKAHPFMTFGVQTNAQLNPYQQDIAIKNLYCCGSMLSGYDPVFEGSGGGVAIATAYYAIKQALQIDSTIYSTLEARV
ncbi:glycerol-3-phosphate dehydrogenase subunit GlpB [Vibrio sp. V27_P1S3P104]|uniref:glycerol-3-phosphate dehydrogenase subunit GlpB n=1 Tax=unclassified Vibrio TaxID=2614977 RepID=UPI001372F883|nr:MULTISPECIES: glycerol-3-phosphate dehydrogenase subunit GlpB [unclassified Vibrio]NAW69096.1 glycerol-3-phosphate dehydrogenase subunit GlpB [Vibrio sp. V28_P6S34P95]NAX06337.1 glycerol-3-phosphate dehydrogenase subunit GlpB [Vibrio sp. V30_P3S12P165]NAX34360.1 glycerol-3-phosphate dehydrogenase subunit GlpB [Vibrio sp. V29_P1S30P107]NAX36061.1 glycerol-3-phosphate dehydrogenase subunit GlpB [Vibrio sp. V27_P1S3P104]NAX39346.1 glycerol-3-phosphate dehydrogenase subunit GlpB [Vibrio sp. V26